MLFILYSEVNANSIGANLGMPEYSYYFVLRGFQKALQSIGDVIVVHDPEHEVDTIYREQKQLGVPCVFLSFSPPNKTLTSLQCPTFCVFAWEFNNLPDGAWDGQPESDWSVVLSRLSGAITLSTYTVDVVRRELGEAYRIAAIPVPNFLLPAVRGTADLTSRQLLVDCNVIDSGFYRVTSDAFAASIPPDCFRPREWCGERVDLTFKVGDEGAALMGGFYEPEPWGGAWSRIAEPWVLLPFAMSGRCKVGLEVTAYGPNVGKQIAIDIGGHEFVLPLIDDFREHEFVIDCEQPVNLIQFREIDVTVMPQARDPRSMGIGLRKLWVEKISGEMEPLSSQLTSEPISLRFDGVIYTSVLNPGDDRKNWVEMLTAFCYAFRNEPRATLILKMTHRSIGAFLERFHYTLQRVGEIKCRVVILHGYLSDVAYQQLIDISTYCINSSRCEGLCIPLMEFMSCGVPAIAPNHTAMRDYVSPDNTFIVESSLEPGVWPHNPQALLNTLRYRVNWRSLVTAYEASFAVAQSDQEKYRTMSESASYVQRNFCAQDVVEKKLSSFFSASSFDSAADGLQMTADSGVTK